MNNNINNDLQQPVVQIANQKGGFHYIYAISLVYVLSIYLVPVIASILGSMGIETAFHLFWLPVIIGIVILIASIKCCKPGNRIVLLNAAVLIKYSLIPFFVFMVCLIVVSGLFSFIPVPFMIFVGPIFVLVEVVVAWFVVALGAPVSISYLCVSAKEKLRPKGMVVLHSLLQYFFVFDVIDVMILTLKEHKWKKLTITIIILLSIFAVLIMLLLVLGIHGFANYMHDIIGS
ncbi:MAG: hypothetical protein J6D02_13440 [Lachnospira sp.]|nr:hypothetical protein [Lachnospira sp.]